MHPINSPSPTAAAWAYFVIFADRAFMPFLYTAAKIVQFSFPAVWVIAIRRKRIYRKYPRSAALFPGMLSGLALAVGMGAVYWGFFRGSLPVGAASRIAARVEAFGVTTPFTYPWISEARSLNEEGRQKERHPPLSEAEEDTRNEEQEALRRREAVP